MHALTRLAAIAALVLASTTSLRAQGGDLAIRGATVIDGTGSPPRAGTTIVVEDGRIVEVTSDAEADVPEGVRTLDAAGKHVIPGLADMHVHFASGGMDREDPSTTDRLLRQFLFYGVTSLLNVGATGGGTDDITRLRERGADEVRPMPHVYATGSMLTVPGSHPVATIMRLPEGADPATYDWSERGITLVETVEEARAAVRRNAEGGMDGIKIVVESGPRGFGDDHPQMPREMVEAVVGEAEARGLPVVAHVSSLDEFEVCLEAGVRGIAHTVAEPPFPGPEHWATMVEKEIHYVPTLSIYEAILSDRWTDPAVLDDPFLSAGVPASTLDSMRGWRHPAWRSPAGMRADVWQGILASLEAAHEAGVAVGFGTDTGNPFVFPGSSAHVELEIMVDAGLTPMETIVAATRRPAEMLGEDHEFGTIEVGKRADLLVLAGDPLEDVRNTRTLETVVLEGKIVDRSTILSKE